MRQARRRAALDGSLTVFVAVDGEPAGALLLEDPIRPDAPRMMRALREAGIARVVLVTGDRADIAETVGRIVGVDAVLRRLRPGREARRDRSRSRARQPTIMVGDGINDAPALAAAGVGVALAARGRDRLVRGRRRRAHRRPGRRARRRDPHRPPVASAIALQAAVVGMGCRWWPWSPPPPGCCRRRPARCCRR